LREDHLQIAKADVQVLGISVDHIWSHKAFAHSLGDLPFPLLADWDKSVARRYGVLLEDRGVAQRSLFLIDYRGYLRWSNPKFNMRDPVEYSALIEAMATLPRIPTSPKPA
jgi:alkyl hydroperoxide reductase subunit AhpC